MGLQVHILGVLSIPETAGVVRVAPPPGKIYRFRHVHGISKHHGREFRVSLG